MASTTRKINQPVKDRDTTAAKKEATEIKELEKFLTKYLEDNPEFLDTLKKAAKAKEKLYETLKDNGFERDKATVLDLMDKSL